MSEKIQTKPFNYGDEKEAEWPPKYPSCKGGVWYYDKESRTMREGYPPSKNVPFDKAPYIIGDTIEKYYHPKACKWTESRSELNMLDDVCGTITTDKHIPPDPSKQKELKRERKKDITESLHKAVAQVDAGTAPLTEETRAKCEIQNRIVSEALNFDAFNAVGRKNDKRGKKYRRR